MIVELCIGIYNHSLFPVHYRIIRYHDFHMMMIKKNFINEGSFKMVLLYSILKPKKKSTQWLHEVNSQEVELTLSNQSIIEQCHSIGLSLQDLKIAKTIQILIKENANAIASVFFKGMSHIPGYTSIIQRIFK